MPTPNIGQNELERILLELDRRVRNVEAESMRHIARNAYVNVLTTSAIPNDDITYTAAYAPSLAIPANARLLNLHVEINATAIANAACSWSLGVWWDSGTINEPNIVSSVRRHNVGYANQWMGCVINAWFTVGAHVELRPYLNVAVDSGSGSGIGIGPGNFMYNWFS